MLRVYFGHHKCGSRAVRSILRDDAARRGVRLWSYDDFLPDPGPKFEFWNLPEIDDPIRLSEIPDDDIVCYINATPERLHEVRRQRRPFRAVEVVRDPRNVLVSAYGTTRPTTRLRRPVGDGRSWRLCNQRSAHSMQTPGSAWR